MIRHAFAEGRLLLMHRWAVTTGLTVALAVPIALAGVTWSVARWLEPVVGLAEQDVVVPVLLHPRMNADQRRQWIEAQRQAHPEWRLEEVSPDRLADRLVQWFPYLEGLLEDGGAGMLSPLVEIVADNPEEIAELERSPAVVAVGPRSSVHQSIGLAGRLLVWVLGLTSGGLLVAAGVFTAVWVHLELFRHGDEIAIMRLIGATEPTVRGPFVVATLVPGVAAALVAVGGTLVAVGGLSGALTSLGLPPLRLSGAAIIGQLLVGGAVPLVTAMVTLTRHAGIEFEER